MFLFRRRPTHVFSLLIGSFKKNQKVLVKRPTKHHIINLQAHYLQLFKYICKFIFLIDMLASPGNENNNLRKRVGTPQDSGTSSTTRTIGWEELESHNTLDSCWIAIENKVYDVTEWIPKHPGGRSAILQVGGREVTDLVKAYHVDACWRTRVKRMYLGEFDENSCKYKKRGNTAFAQDIRDLTAKMEKEGWYVPSVSYYVQKTIQSLLIFAAAWACVIYGWNVGNVYIQYLGGFLVGCFWHQSNFLGHDAGHQAVIQNRYWNNIYGIFVGNIFAGLSIAWWRHSHYTHHVVTNVITHDPDIQHLPVFAITPNFFKVNHKKQIKQYGEVFFWKLSQYIVSMQQYLFYPVMTVARINLHALSVVHVLTHENCPNRLLELFALGLFWVWWIFMLSFLPDTTSLVTFYYLSHLSVSLIHVQICISHFLMETYDAVPMKKEDESVYEFQLRTTLDVNCPAYMDWIHGGLQFQAVHHIFPRLPRHRLREAQGHLIRLCDKHNVTYRRYSFWEANALTIEHMAGVAKSCSKGEIVKLNDTMLFNGFYCIG